MEEIENMSSMDIINLYPKMIKELKKRKVIETNNLVGDVGQFMAIEYYNKNSNLPNLDASPAGTRHMDAISRKGERYSIKSVTTYKHPLNSLCWAQKYRRATVDLNAR